jgi:hypothetical protein
MRLANGDNPRKRHRQTLESKFEAVRQVDSILLERSEKSL